MPVPPARRKKVMSMFPEQFDRVSQQEQPVSTLCLYIYITYGLGALPTYIHVHTVHVPGI